jgi:quercetin dioxygenase-like cupin family protein
VTGTHTFVQDLAALLGEIPEDSIISRTFFQDEKYRAILFGFAPSQELSEHTAARPAILHILEGEATLTLGDELHEVSAGAWAHMPANLAHSVYAKTKVAMLLVLL